MTNRLYINDNVIIDSVKLKKKCSYSSASSGLYKKNHIKRNFNAIFKDFHSEIVF